ncbi:MAG: eCIS core domain-containing protein [Arenimonas sp.]
MNSYASRSIGKANAEITDATRTRTVRTSTPFIQAKTACGCGGRCPRCNQEANNENPVLQKKLQIGAANDPYELEADRIADKISETPASDAIHANAPLHIQRISASKTAQPGNAPPSTDKVLASSGKPLEINLKQQMEQHFSHDFSKVKIHSDSEAAQSANEINADAYTAGNSIAFAAGKFAPDTKNGRHLLAHELTHVVQQSASGTMLQRQTPSPPATSPWRTSGTICERPSHENTDFPTTHITRVSVDLSAQQLSLTWDNPSSLNLPTGPYDISAGAGLCCRNCDDETASQTSGSLCTPKGTFRVHSKGCVLSSTSWAKNPTYFSRAGIAIHAGPIPGFPASHGCVRTTEEASEIIHDNSVYSASYAADEERGLLDRRTEIQVSGTWSGSQCYPSSSADRVSRASRCSSGKSSGSKRSGENSDSDGPGITAPTAVGLESAATETDGAGPG